MRGLHIEYVTSNEFNPKRVPDKNIGTFFIT